MHTRPGFPLRSPIMRTRQAPGGRGALPFAGLPRRVRPAGAGWGSVLTERSLAARSAGQSAADFAGPGIPGALMRTSSSSGAL